MRRARRGSNQNSPRERMRARILLAASDPAALSDQQIAAQVGASALTVRRRFAERGLVGALHHGKPGATHPRRGRLGAKPQRRRCARKLALYHCRRSHQAQASLPYRPTLKKP
jgi:hypothetical protein